MRNFKEALRHRRSYYYLKAKSPVTDEAIEEIVRFAVKHVPSAFNSQSTRAVLLLGQNHTVLWEIVKETLRPLVSTEEYPQTEAKINNCFAAGYGSVLFFEDSDRVETMQEQFPLYAENFTVWSQHTSAMHQLTVWTMLEDAGFGASLQHYNPLIDEAVRAKWDLPKSWRLVAQMPFGAPGSEPQEKSFLPLDERVKVFK